MRLPALISGLALCAACLADPEAFLTRPDIHGSQVVFTAEGDLWLADLRDGEAHRLTSDPGVETNAHFSPDGSKIAFTAGYDGGSDVYVIPTTGGVPKRLTYDPRSADVLGWTPDGQSVLFRSGSKMYAPGFESFVTRQLFTVPVNGGMPKPLPVPRGSFASLNPDGHTLAYVPTSNEWMNWFRYEAGEADKVWLADLSTGKFKQLTDSNGVDTEPVWAGSAIYFVSERSGVRNLWRLDPATKKVKQITFSTDAPVGHPSSDGARVVFELGPRLQVYDAASNQLSTVPVHLNSDHVHARPFEAPVGPGQDACIGPTGKRVAIVSRGHLVTVPADEGSMRVLVSDSSQRVQNPAWSPDGKRIAYVSDASGEEQLHVLETADDAKPKQLTKDLGGENGTPVWSPDGKFLLIGNRAGDFKLVDSASGAVKVIVHTKGPLEYDNIQNDFSFSPDSKWIAYTAIPDRLITQVSLYNIAAGKSTAVTDPDIASASPVFSPDGKYLYVLQQRAVSNTESFPSLRLVHNYASKVTAYALASSTGTPFDPKDDDEAEAAKKPEEAPAKETKVDLDGIQDRYFDMKAPQGEYTGLMALQSRLLLMGNREIQAYDIAAKKITPLASGVSAIELSRDRKKLLVGGGAGLQVIDPNGGPVPPGTGALKLAGLTITVDPVAEWRQMFYETWRVGRDFFYDPNTHGVNWQAVKKRYEAELPMVASRADLTSLLGRMIAEFNTGHCYVGGPTPFVGRPSRAGLLGVDLAWDGTASAYKITHILRGDSWSPEMRSPFAEPGVNVHEGDYLLKIRGTALRQDQDPAALLLGTAGHTISVTVNSKPAATGARTVSIVPLPDESGLRSQDWINSRKAYVAKASGGQIGYVYLSDMSGPGADEFAKMYYPNVGKPAIIVDVRGNGGGFISGNLLNDLSSKVTGYFAFRAGGEWRREGWAPAGQVVALTDEYAFSDGEYFSEFFKRMKIGPLIGHRTGGGEVGSGGGYRMVDGGAVFIPNYGAWVPGEWIIEGRGAVPDIEVDQDPAAVMAGKDPQLDKAIAVIMENLKRHPFKEPEHPPYPVKLGGSRGGHG